MDCDQHVKKNGPSRFKRGLNVAVCLSLISLAGGVASARPSLHRVEVDLRERPTSLDDQIARRLRADDLKAAHAQNELPIVLTAPAALSHDHHIKALFVQLQSARLCGSAGCSTTLFIHRDGRWSTALDSISGTIAILPSRHGKMYDLLINKKSKWVWRHGAYQDTSPLSP